MTIRPETGRLLAAGCGPLRSSLPLLLGVLLLGLSGARPAHAQIPGYPPSYSNMPVSTVCGSGDVTCSCPYCSNGYWVVASTGPLTIQFTAAPALCSNVQVAVSVTAPNHPPGTVVGTSGFLAPGQSMTPLTTQVDAGTYLVSFTPTFQVAGCNSGVGFVFGTVSIGPQSDPVPALSVWGFGALAAALAGCAVLAMTKAFRARV